MSGQRFLRNGERLDDLMRNGYRIIQRPGTFCFGIDAVLLSGFAVVKEGERVLDLGTGTGIVPLLLRAKTRGKQFYGIEIQKESADMARRSVALNGLQEDIFIVTGDLRQADRLFGRASFDVLTSNPPYIPVSEGLPNPNPALAIARHEICCTLEDVIGQASVLLREKGRFYLVHRPARLPLILDALGRGHLDPKRLRMVHSFPDKEANLVLIEAIKGVRSRLTVMKPLFIFEEQGRYSREIIEEYGF